MIGGGRRGFLLGAFFVPLAGLVRPDAVPTRRALFEEVDGQVMLTIELPGLFRWSDTEALASIDSGFDTNLVYALRLWKYGGRALLREFEFTVKVRRDPWTKQYVVRTETGEGWVKREFELRAEALVHATTLRRVPLIATPKLERGPHYYFVEVIALRNPLETEAAGRSRWSSERGGGRDLEWFGRIVEIVAGEAPQAEESVHVRTNPFYLLPR